MIAQAIGGIIFWVVFTGGGEPMDARPNRQFNDMQACLREVERYHASPKIQEVVNKLRREANINTAYLCLPIGVKP